MAQPFLATSGNEEKVVSRTNSFTKFLRSPSRSPKTMKKSPSGNPLTKLLFGRRSSKKNLEGDSVKADSETDEQENVPSLIIEEVKEIVGTAIDDFVHRDDNQTSAKQMVDDVVSTKPTEEPSTETKDSKLTLLDKFKEESQVVNQTREIKHNLLDNINEGLGKAKEGLKEALTEDYSKAKGELTTILPKEQSSGGITEDANKAPKLAQKLQEGAVAAVSKIDDVIKGELQPEQSKERGVKNKEDGCVSSLAQGLEKMCAPWSSKKQE